MDWFSAPGYWLSRLVFTRALALIYLIAFVCAGNQFRPLLGTDGLLPIPAFVARTPFRRSPSLFHLHYSDRFLAGCCAVGSLLALAALTGVADQLPAWGWMLTWLLLWGLYLSIVNVGQIWYAFGWESLLLETGFLAVFLGPAGVAPPRLVLWLLRWLLFRLEFGAGLIKMRGDRCWRDLTCLYYHHETQPMPGPLSWYFHQLPAPLHRLEALANHLTQLGVVFALFGPQPVASAAALVVIVTQGWLMLSGNFAWLNALSLALALSALSGPLLHDVLPIPPPTTLPSPTWFRAAGVAVTAVVATLSYWPVRNMLSRQQRMNASFTPLHLVNSYGAFGHVTRQRTEVVIEGTDDPLPGPGSHWREYEFKGKPGDPRRRPPQIAPYHLRLDWLLWFVALSPGYGRSWLGPFLQKLLANDPATLRLLRSSPFPDQPPVWLRVQLYRYRFSSRADRTGSGLWWRRDRPVPLIGPVRREQPGRS